MLDRINLKALGIATTVTFGLLGLGLLATGVINKPSTASSTTKAVITADVPETTSKLQISSSKTKSLKLLTVPAEQVVVLNDEVAENAYAIASAITQKTEKGKAVYLLINSPGGSVLQGALITSAMEAAKGPVNTVCMQLCASMAAIIHQYGTNRYVLDRSILMFHDAAGGMQGYFPHMRSEFDAIDRYVNKFDSYIAQRNGLSYENWMNTVHKNLWIDGEDAVNNKFAEGLVFVKVMDDGKVMPLSLLLKPALKPVNTQTSPANPQTVFDVKL